MKTQFTLLRIATMVVMAITFFSCSQEGDPLNNTSGVSTEYFPVKNANGSFAQSIRPEVIPAVYAKLKQEGRESDAQKFLKTYDKDGMLVAGALKKYSSATSSPNTREVAVDYGAHIQNTGWVYGPGNEYVGNGQFIYLGTTGQNKRLEAFFVTLSNQPINYEYYYGGWSATLGNGQIAGTVNLHQPIQAVRFWINSGGLVQYRSHVSNVGWESSFRDQGGISGTEGGNKIEQIQLYFVLW